MANIQPRKNKDGKTISYSIRVHKGRDPITGKQLKPYTMTWEVPDGWSEKTAEKEALKQAVIFERQCKDGIALDNRQTFAGYAEYVIGVKERAGLKYRSRDLYQAVKERIFPAIGHIKIADIRPQHLNQLYEQLSQPGLRKRTDKISAKFDFQELLKEKGLSMLALSNQSGVGYHRIMNLCEGKTIRSDGAKEIAEALQISANTLFTFIKDDSPLKGRTILEYHRFISSVLSQAVKEMLIPFNPASRATPPKAEPHEPNYFQPEDVERIFEALEQEPIKWRTMIHLYLITGCRRGELIGLKWEKVDWENNQIYVDRALLYSTVMGTYEDTPKTKTSVRYIKLPEETVSLLKEYSHWQAEQRLLWGDKWQNSGYVFPNESGGAIFPGLVSNWLSDFAKRHGLPHINPHAFRHTQASILFFNGVDAVSISKRLGHAHVSTTTDIYSHIVRQAEERVNDCIADVMLRSGRKERPTQTVENS